MVTALHYRLLREGLPSLEILQNCLDTILGCALWVGPGDPLWFLPTTPILGFWDSVPHMVTSLSPCHRLASSLLLMGIMLSCSAPEGVIFEEPALVTTTPRSKVTLRCLDSSYAHVTPLCSLLVQILLLIPA